MKLIHILKSAKIAILIIFISSIIIFGLGTMIYINQQGPLDKEKTIVIPAGYSVKKTAYLLSDNKIIEHPIIFYLIIKLTNKKIQAGEYSFEKNDIPINIIDKLENGKIVFHKITIQEGLTNTEIINKIKNIPILVGDITREFTEGYLLPETYSYIYGENRNDLLNRINHKALDEFAKLWARKQPDLPYKTMEEALVMASIIEKETGMSSERKRVASVFINRLNKRMKLQADPTVAYSITKGKFDLKRPLNKNDLLHDSPYNTYLYLGLPPKPIANPGILSIEAALNPDKTDDLYFVVDGKGGHNFANNLTQHNINVMKYRNLKKENR